MDSVKLLSRNGRRQLSLDITIVFANVLMSKTIKLFCDYIENIGLASFLTVELQQQIFYIQIVQFNLTIKFNVKKTTRQ